jgi:hypothetical protein
MEGPMTQLRLIKVKRNDRLDYVYDCERIVKVLASHGYHATIEQAHELWDAHSEMMAAGWLHLPEDDEQLYIDLSYHFEEVEGTYIIHDPFTITID